MAPIEGAAVPVESILARHTARRAFYVAPPVIALFWLTRGAEGAWSSALGVAVVVGVLLASGAMMSVAARISLSMYHAAALIGFVLRLALVTGGMLLVATLLDVDRLAFGVSAVVTYVVLIALEMAAVARGKERELDWTP
jgi:hypothetical protein